MNKAKIIFVALIALATIGGVFAFKASKFTNLWGHTTTLDTYTFTTAVGGPIYTAAGIVYCTPNVFVTRQQPGTPTLTATTVVPAQITGTAPGGFTTTILLPFKNCAPRVNVFLTDEA